MKKLLVDVDCGVDDAQAIMMALAAPGVQILGITCVQGNTSVDNVCKNVLRVLKVCNHPEIPVFRGATKSLLGQTISAGDFHGKDGLGDAPHPDAPGLDLVQKEGAVSAMIRIVNENPGEVSLVATAPLTNVALAVKLDPTFPQKLKGLYLMGGNTDCTRPTPIESASAIEARVRADFDLRLGRAAIMSVIGKKCVRAQFAARWGDGDVRTVCHDSVKNRSSRQRICDKMKARGNITVCGEYNFAADPEAAYIVLNEFICPVYIASWEFTCRSELPWAFCDGWLAQDTDKARFMKQIFKQIMESSSSNKTQGFISCDSYAMAAAIDETYIIETDHKAVTVELAGNFCRGMMVVDHLEILKKTHKAHILKKVDLEKFKTLMMNALK
ncbi:inosine-uridine preferring nucleoside hydrolase-like protein [Labeo rohita]|uniref:Inosine-uridine preferring nucleoside hydrolase-like protein n=1 Tax=Labeo rohita TaxID=84645 RepID=A0A498NDR9_LABRO|nr:inosine-uridine preferring nucleoside hydrolase-like protein [Labeo rohita]